MGIVVCVEDLLAGSILRCVALEGRGSGLGITRDGRVLWKEPGELAFELVVSQDGRLVLLRPEGAPPSSVHRAGRSVDAPPESPVVLVDGDDVHLGEHRLRLHQHGTTRRVFRPELLRRAALAAGFLAATAACGGFGDTDIEVIDQPPVAVAEPCPQVTPMELSFPEVDDSPWEAEVVISEPCMGGVVPDGTEVSSESPDLFLSEVQDQGEPYPTTATFTVTAVPPAAPVEAEILVKTGFEEIPEVVVPVKISPAGE